MKAEDETNNKLDMSLDEIIKLDKKEARKNRRVQQTLAIRGRRQNASQYRQKPRISAAATRLRGLRQKRLSRINRPIQGSSSQHQVLTKNKRVFTVKNIRSSRSTAQAVLRRAQRTAAAAARTAADATALLQRNRIQRQQLFNERRNIQPTSRIAYERRPSRRRSAPASTVGSRGAYTTPQVTGRSWQSEQQSLNFQRRPRRRSLQVLGSPQGRRTSFRGALSRNNSLRNNTFVRNQRWGQRTNFRSSSRGQQRNGYTLTPTGRPTSRARNAEYLAQARALIQAQNENAQRYDLDSPNTTVWNPRTYSAPHRNLNYYAKYWDN
ncbi:unnamed protein product [Schistosoma margrebowiei]|uniref:Uncharacterized protein n=1 Tax=Schistosoma margrebowiei TaxID=48269 RepID=A0AA84ZH51_9TREM|nr:unnamed protein product [Schistosoma margrebowiei]